LLSGVNRRDFKGSCTLFYATTRALEIFSDASRRLPDELPERHSHLPWRATVDEDGHYVCAVAL
jgi:uncharacterized protein with HEPN domain